MYITDKTFYNTYFLLKHIQNKQQKRKTRRMCDLVFVKLTSQSGLMAVAAVLHEFSRCSSEVCDAILLFLCFILEKSYSQMYVLQKWQ